MVTRAGAPLGATPYVRAGLGDPAVRGVAIALPAKRSFRARREGGDPAGLTRAAGLWVGGPKPPRRIRLLVDRLLG